MLSGLPLLIAIPLPTPSTTYRNTTAFSLSVQHLTCVNYPRTQFLSRHDYAYSPLLLISTVYVLCLCLCNKLYPSKLCYPILTNAFQRTL